jgi:hypothetical protein
MSQARRTNAGWCRDHPPRLLTSSRSEANEERLVVSCAYFTEFASFANFMALRLEGILECFVPRGRRPRRWGEPLP